MVEALEIATKTSINLFSENTVSFRPVFTKCFFPGIIWNRQRSSHGKTSLRPGHDRGGRDQGTGRVRLQPLRAHQPCARGGAQVASAPGQARRSQAPDISSAVQQLPPPHRPPSRGQGRRRRQCDLRCPTATAWNRLARIARAVSGPPFTPPIKTRVTRPRQLVFMSGALLIV